jgi:predicted phosphodiesterase
MLHGALSHQAALNFAGQWRGTRSHWCAASDLPPLRTLSGDADVVFDGHTHDMTDRVVNGPAAAYLRRFLSAT